MSQQVIRRDFVCALVLARLYLRLLVQITGAFAAARGQTNLPG